MPCTEVCSQQCNIERLSNLEISLPITDIHWPQSNQSNVSDEQPTPTFCRQFVKTCDPENHFFRFSKALANVSTCCHYEAPQSSQSEGADKEACTAPNDLLSEAANGLKMIQTSLALLRHWLISSKSFCAKVSRSSIMIIPGPSLKIGQQDPKTAADVVSTFGSLRIERYPT